MSETKGDWNWGNVQSAGGGCLVVGDQLRFYFSGRAGVSPAMRDGNGATGLAFLRRDGFASMDAGAGAGTLTTRPLKFNGSHLFVNLAAPKGELRAELLDEHGKAIAPFTAANCKPIAHADATKLELTWTGASDLSAVAGRAAKIRFTLHDGALYSFWISQETNGASHGYVAAGGPGFTGPRDTTGN
jgi:hypothetical protein